MRGKEPIRIQPFSNIIWHLPLLQPNQCVYNSKFAKHFVEFSNGDNSSWACDILTSWVLNIWVIKIIKH